MCGFNLIMSQSLCISNIFRNIIQTFKLFNDFKPIRAFLGKVFRFFFSTKTRLFETVPLRLFFCQSSILNEHAKYKQSQTIFNKQHPTDIVQSIHKRYFHWFQSTFKSRRKYKENNLIFICIENCRMLHDNRYLLTRREKTWTICLMGMVIFCYSKRKTNVV